MTALATRLLHWAEQREDGRIRYAGLAEGAAVDELVAAGLARIEEDSYSAGRGGVLTLNPTGAAMTGIKVGDIVKHREGYHAKVRERSTSRPSTWHVSPIESWARTRLTLTAREVIGIYRPLKGSR